MAIDRDLIHPATLLTIELIHRNVDARTPLDACVIAPIFEQAYYSLEAGIQRIEDSPRNKSSWEMDDPAS